MFLELSFFLNITNIQIVWQCEFNKLITYNVWLEVVTGT